MSFRESALLVAFWVTTGLLFGFSVFLFLGAPKGLEFLTAYIVEYSLSMDNIFIFIVIFSYFAVPPEARPRALLFGILGAIFFRGVFIFAGIELVQRAIWAFFPLGALLLYTAIRLLLHKEQETRPDRIWLVRLGKRFFNFSDTYEGASFFVRRGGQLLATPLLIVVLAIEGVDIIFAIDSVPAVLGITQDRLIAYSSNLFAILGLRALYFLLASLLIKFSYLHYGLALILGFIAVKLLLKPFHIEIPTDIALGVVVSILALSILVSLVKVIPRPPGK